MASTATKLARAEPLTLSEPPERRAIWLRSCNHCGVDLHVRRTVCTECGQRQVSKRDLALAAHREAAPPPAVSVHGDDDVTPVPSSASPLSADSPLSDAREAAPAPRPRSARVLAYAASHPRPRSETSPGRRVAARPPPPRSAPRPRPPASASPEDVSYHRWRDQMQSVWSAVEEAAPPPAAAGDESASTSDYDADGEVEDAAAAAPKRPRPAEGPVPLTIENLKKLKRLARLRAFIDRTEGPSAEIGEPSSPGLMALLEVASRVKTE